MYVYIYLNLQSRAREVADEALWAEEWVEQGWPKQVSLVGLQRVAQGKFP